jgi:hypothetical protein
LQQAGVLVKLPANTALRANGVAAEAPVAALITPCYAKIDITSCGNTGGIPIPAFLQA